MVAKTLMQNLELETCMLLYTLLMTAAVAGLTPVAPRQTLTDTPTMETGAATIQAINETKRSVTLKFDDDSSDTFTVGPDVKRFNELKVGQKIHFRYYESVAYTLRKAGSPEAGPKPSDSTSRTPGTGPRPSGTYGHQEKATVTVVSVDPARPSITVKTAAGQTVTHLVKEKDRLSGIQPGDRLDIVYTEALLVSVQPES